MTYIPSATKDFVTYVDIDADKTPAVAATKVPRRGLWARVFDAIWTARQRQADIEIARYLALSGGKLTDSVEREISRRMSSDNFRLR